MPSAAIPKIDTGRHDLRRLEPGARKNRQLPMEYSNVLRSACRKGELSAQDAQSAIAALKQLPIEIDATAPDAAMLLSLALRFDLSAYDAVHLELALRKQLCIATQDRALAEAALLAGVGLVALSIGSV